MEQSEKAGVVLNGLIKSTGKLANS
jgi:hypothetical protein